MESMKKMKEYGKQIEKIKLRHKADKKKQVEAINQFYKEKGINPGAGCLPYLLQIVILIALFNVFTRVLSGSDDVVVKLNELLYPFLHFGTGESINTHFLYLNLTKPDILTFLPFPFPGPLLILSALAQLISAKMMAPYVKQEEKFAKSTKTETDDFAASMQKSTLYTFPLMTLLFGIGFSSGLALYWLLFSLFQVYTQYRSSGWGGATPWLIKIGLLKSHPESK